MIDVEALSKHRGKRAVVSDVTFRCEPGTVTGFLGPNGAGKTTTLRMLTGLSAPDSGQALILGGRYRDLPNPGRRVGILLDASAHHTRALRTADRVDRDRLTVLLGRSRTLAGHTPRPRLATPRGPEHHAVGTRRHRARTLDAAATADRHLADHATRGGLVKTAGGSQRAPLNTPPDGGQDDQHRILKKDGLVKVARAQNQSEAELVQGLLRKEGVPSVLRRAPGFDVPEFLAAGERDVLVRASAERVTRELLPQGDARTPVG